MMMKIRINGTDKRIADSKTIEIECEGSGTEEDPLILEVSDNFPKYRLMIFNQKKFLVIKGFILPYLHLDSCKNVIIEDCEFNLVRILHSSDIGINKVSASDSFGILDCTNISINNCFIATLGIVKSKNSLIEQSHIFRYKEIRSEGTMKIESKLRNVIFNFSLHYFAHKYRMLFPTMLICTFPVFLIPIVFEAYTVLLTFIGILLGFIMILLFYFYIVKSMKNKYYKRRIRKKKIKLGIINSHLKKDDQMKRYIEHKTNINAKILDNSSIFFNLIDFFGAETRNFLGITGSGVFNDPYIINSMNNIARVLFFENSDDFIKIIDCDLISIYLKIIHCRNLIFENCNIGGCEITMSSDIKFLNCNITIDLSMYRSNRISIEHSKLSKLELSLCKKNVFKKNIIDRILTENSRGNQFEQCEFSNKDVNEQVLNPALQNSPKKDIFITWITLILIVLFTIFSILVFLFTTYFLGGLMLGFINIIPLWGYFKTNKQEKNNFRRIQPLIEEMNLLSFNRII